MNFGLMKIYYDDVNEWYNKAKLPESIQTDYLYSIDSTGKRFNVLAHLSYLGGGEHFDFTDLQSIQWEPTLIQNDTINNFPRVFDSSNPVFGFGHYIGELYNSYEPNEVNKPQSEHISKLFPEDIDGTEWYLSMNLRRLDTNSTNKDLTSILRVKMKWYTPEHNGQIDSGYIKFHSIPSPFKDDTTHINWEDGDNRGIKQNLLKDEGVESFEITRNMLPLHTDLEGPDITINSIFLCDNVDTTLSNLKLNNVKRNATGVIDRIQFEVEYLGNEDIGIDWIKIQQPAAKYLYEGMIDDAVVDHLEGFWQQVAVDSFMNKGMYFPRIHDRHEYPSMAHFGPVRYFNKLLGGIVVSETESFDEEKYHRYLGTSSRWPITWGTTSLWSVPYFRYGQPHPDSISSGDVLPKMKYGFFPRNPEQNWRFGVLDSLSSAWETFTVAPNWPIQKINNLTELVQLHESNPEHFWTYLEWTDSYLVNKEQRHYKPFYEKRYMFYSEKPLWAQTQIYSHFGSHDTIPYDVYFLYGNPMTKEQVQNSLWWNIIHGAKGQLFDGSYSSNFINESVGGSNQLMTKLYHNQNFLNERELDTLTSWDLIDIDKIGSDFVKEVDSTEWTGINQKLDFDALEKYYEMYPNRFYLGRKTHRRELLKMITYIDFIDSTLLDLRMQAFYWKGLVTYEDHHPNNFKYHDNFVLEDYLNLDNIKTKKIFRPNLNLNHNASPDYEHIDSSFFDITLLNHKNEKIIHNKYNDIYLGVINRRTDPLIFNDSAGVKKEMQFYSGAEFDDFVRDSNSNNDLFGVARDSSWWQTQWWRRLGAREISIPFNMKPFGNAKYIEIKELGVDSLDNLGWWYWDPFYHKIDTALMHNRTLKTKLLPGQGKLLHISFKSIFSNSCDACDQFNDFENFNIVFKPDSIDACCFNLSFLYSDLECDLNDLNLRVIVDSTNDVDLEFESNQFQDSISNSRYFFDFDFDLGRLDDSVFVGQLCVPSNSESYKVEFMIGKDTLGEFSSCDRKAQYEISCNEDIKDCCDSIEVSTEYYEYGIDSSSAEGCCTDFYLKSFNSNECIYGMDLVFENRIRKSFAVIDSVPLTYNIIDSVKIGSFCMPMSICHHEGPEEPDPVLIPMQLKFYASDSTEICNKTIEIEACCIWAVLDGDIESDIILEKQIFNEGLNKSIDPKNKNYIYPNPNNGNFTLSYFSNNSSKVNINLIDINGQVKLLLDNVDVISGNNQIPIDNSNLTTGYYYVIIKDKNETITVPFIIEN